MIEDDIIREIKPLIEAGDLHTIQERWQEYYEDTDFGRELAWDYLFQKIYLHAALKKKKDICLWLDGLFLSFNPMTKIALRQMFSYANYLLRQ
jgi:hypothetical protein